MSSYDLIETADAAAAVDNNNNNSRAIDRNRKKSRRRNRDARYDPVVGVNSAAELQQEEAAAVDASNLINILNENTRDTVANTILTDSSTHKVETLKTLGKVSAVAKSLSKDLEESTEQRHAFTTLRATNVLRFLSNVYDNQL
nr:P12 [Calliteara abietis nucleopolyhedrovirus]